MSEPFITQLDTELPLVVLIHDESVFSQSIFSALEKTSFEVVLVKHSHLEADSLKTLLKSPRLFRVLFVAEKQQSLVKSWQKLQTFGFQVRHGYGIASADASNSDQDIDENLSVLFLRDILAPELFPWKQLVQPARQVVLDYQSNLYPLSPDEVRRVVLHYIAHPRPRSLQITQGAPVSSGSLAQHLVRLLAAKKGGEWRIVAQPLHRQLQLSLPPHELARSGSVAELADQIIKIVDFSAFNNAETPAVKKTFAQPTMSPLTFTQPAIPVIQPLPHHYPKTIHIPKLQPPVIVLREEKPVRATSVVTPRTLEEKLESNLETKAKPQREIKSESRPPTKRPTRVEPSSKAETKEIATIVPQVELKSTQELDTMLQKLFAEERVQQKEEVVKKLTTTTVKTSKTNRYRKRLYRLSLVIFIALAAVSSVFALSAAAFFQLQHATQKGEIASAFSRHWLATSVPLVREMLDVVPLPSLNNYLDDTLFLTSYQQQQQQLFDTREQFGAFLAQVMAPQTEGDVFANWTQLSQDLASHYQQFSLLEAQVKNNALDTQEASWRPLREQLASQRRNLAALNQLQTHIPSLLAKDGKRTYAVLLADNTELRPSGGKIVAVGFVEMSNGRLSNAWVTSATELEARFPGRLSTPELVQAMFQRQNWSFSDTLWEPSLSGSSREIIGVLQSSQADEVNGLLVLPVSSLGSIFEVTGPVTLNNQALTGEQLPSELTKLVATSSTGTLNTELYATLLNEVLQDMRALSPTQLVRVTAIMSQLLQNQEAAIFLVDQSEETTIESLGWSGSLLSPTCPAQFNDKPCEVEPFFQVEANLGDTKTNSLLRRSLSHTISLSRQGAQHTRQITLRNTATGNAWPYGAYHAQMQLFMAPEAVLKQITVNGTPLSADAIIQTSYEGRQKVVFPVRVAPQETAHIVVAYDHLFQQDGAFSYAFFDQKQIGIGADPLTITVSYSEDLKPTLVAPQAEFQSNLISFSTPRTSHTFVGISFE